MDEELEQEEELFSETALEDSLDLEVDLEELPL